MIILRNKEFAEKSRKLKDSRVGIGWMDRMKKSDAESYLREAQKAADDAYARGKDDKKVISSAKNAATKKVILDNIGKPALKAAKNGGLAYLGSRFIPSDFINGQIRGAGIHNPELEDKIDKIGKFAKGNAGKIGLAAAAATVAANSPKIYKKVKAARLGAEINTKSRLDKTHKKDKN